MLAPLIAALLLSSSPDGLSAQFSTPQTQFPASADTPTDLDDIVVEGRRLQDMTEDFVREVGQPARGRGLARWQGSVCASVVNLRPETAHYLVDRVSTVAQDVGLRAGAPGCNPNIIIIATDDAAGFSRRLVADRRRLFLLGGAGMDQGFSGLDRFVDSDRAVRWWNVSVPTDSNTGQRAARLPGDVLDGTGKGSAMQYAPQIAVNLVSRMSTQIVDVSERVFVVLDVDKIGGVSLAQLGDYISMISLAQINADADTTGYATVLNLFDDPAQTPGLTNWDKAYLKGLYDAQRTRQNRNSARTEIAASIVRVHHQLSAAETPTQE